MKLVSWDGHNINDGTNYQAILDASAYGLPTIKPSLALRQGSWPLIAGIERPGNLVVFEIYIRGSSLATLQKQLMQWFDPDDETPKKLIGQDAAGGNTRYIYGICQSLDEIPFGAGKRFVVGIQVDGDILWRETTPSAASTWNITATGQSKVVANNGEANCYPILTIETTGAKSGSYPYSRFMAVHWRAGAADNYPVDIANDSLDTQIASTNFALSSGNDLRVWIDGFEVDRWLDGPNTSTTKVWVNLDFAAFIALTLYSAIGAGDTTIKVNESAISGMPNAGILQIDNEIIVYTSKSNTTKEFFGCSRGAKGSTAATHTITTAVKWIQHDITIVYGNAGAGTPPADSTIQPMFTLATSTNTSWDYDDFRVYPGGNKSAQWDGAAVYGTPSLYGGNHNTGANPWAEIGITLDGSVEEGILYITNPCRITNANFQNGEKYSSSGGWYNAEIRSRTSELIPNVTEDTITTPTVAATWQSWSDNEALATDSKAVGLWFSNVGESWAPGTYFSLECADVTLTLNSGYTPQITIVAEQSNYSMDCQILNNTTGQAINLVLSMGLNEQLEVDTDNKTIIYLADGSNQFPALELVDGPRRDWLALAPGNNTLYYYETGVTGISIDIEWEERFYH